MTDLSKLAGDVLDWLNEEQRKRHAIVAVPTRHEAESVMSRLIKYGDVHLWRGHLIAGDNTIIYVVTNQMSSHSRGRQVDRAFIHPEVSDNLRYSILPCTLK